MRVRTELSLHGTNGTPFGLGLKQGINVKQAAGLEVVAGVLLRA